MLATTYGKGHDGMIKYLKALQEKGSFEYSGKADFHKRKGGGSRAQLYGVLNAEGEVGCHLRVEHSWPMRLPGKQTVCYAKDLYYESQVVSIKDRDERAARQHSQVAVGSTGGHRLPICLLYTSPSPRDKCRSRMPSSA